MVSVGPELAEEFYTMTVTIPQAVGYLPSNLC